MNGYGVYTFANGDKYEVKKIDILLFFSKKKYSNN